MYHGPSGPGFVIFIIVAVCATIIMKHYFRSRAGQAQFRREDMVSRAEFDACRDKMEKMEERMRVLERIVTSRRDRLARELSELED
jgi:hypothetical protein